MTAFAVVFGVLALAMAFATFALIETIVGSREVGA